MTDGALAGQRAIVVGGGSGIGLGCARPLAREGAIVTIAGRTEQKLVDAAATRAGDGLEVAHVACARVRQHEDDGGVPRRATHRRHGEVEDIARAMRYFAHASRHGVTGQLLTVDGGNTLWSSIDYRTSSPCPIKEISHGPRTEDH